MDDLAWGLIGASGYAASTAAPAIARASGARLTAVMGSRRTRAEDLARLHGAPYATDDLDELLEGPVDAVWIATPTHLHHPMALAALAAGKHVLLEKPLALRPADAWELVGAAKAAGRILAVGYQARYVPGHQAMAERIQAGDIGRVTAARTFWGIHRDGPPQPWRRSPHQAGWGVLGDIGTHHLDLLRMLVGEVDHAVGITAHQLGYGTEDTAGAALAHTSGAVSTLTVSASVATAGTILEVFGTTGTLRAIDTSPTGLGPVTLERAGAPPMSLAPSEIPSPVLQVEALTKAIAGQDVAYASGADGARNLEILDLIARPRSSEALGGRGL